MNETFRWKYFLIILILLGMGLVFVYLKYYNAPDSYSSIKTLLIKELIAHPKMQIQDIYKFIYQAAMGSEHAVSNRKTVGNWLNKELAELNYKSEETLIDTLPGYLKLVRVNLRPYIKAGYNPDILAEAFFQTANNYKGSLETLKEYLYAVKKMISKNELPFTKDEFNDYISERKREGFPAVHHSAEYRDKYKPAYRVVASEYLKKFIR